MEPEYYVASQILRKAETPMKLVKCDATLEENKSLLGRFQVMGYPSVKLFKNRSGSSWEDYSGPRHSAGIIKYLQKWPQEAAQKLHTIEDLDKLIHQSPVSVIGYFKNNDHHHDDTSEVDNNDHHDDNDDEDRNDGDDDQYLGVFKEVAQKMKYLVEFGILRDDQLVKSVFWGKDGRRGKWEKVKPPGVLVYQHNSQGNTAEFFEISDECRDNATIFEEWVKNNTVPKVVTLDMRNPVTRDQLDVVFKTKITQVIGFDIFVEGADDDSVGADDDVDDVDDDDEYEYVYDEEDDYTDEIEKEASGYVKDKNQEFQLAEQITLELEKQAVKPWKGNYQFIFGDMRSNSDTIKFFGLGEDKLPAYVIYDVIKDQKFLKENANVEDLEQFLKDFEDGKLKRHVKSEPIPEDVPDRVPKMVVAQNFQEVVMNNKNDVLLELFAPWCRNCKRFAPIYQHVAEHFKNDTSQDVFVAVMNVDANDIPDDQFAAIEKIPTVLLIRNDDRAICKFQKDMIDVLPEDVIEFVETRGGENCGIEEIEEKSLTKKDQQNQKKDEL
eukprot:TRINITY_DN1092_c0_g2_i2.p1 TRINITY_DN1092_c0_g2~~TRINITY_DN1092_c0_g2_i2.p1  ORF type:complete len:622 (-),score=134.45 TRINITY_DN1092_c0_g2_i2:643-2298(-)